ncbi:hypothetical protein [Pedobacter frigiditerrae]|uniref:hypothetical protein n=1 Tax=Pedobacter frigiditerrae TaxID=2530452 RepID=UPI00292DA339|nr:hypothetical protein [Pedobacter frigiditerrae]
MKTNNIAFMATEYLFHLSNANDENGIMPSENWKLEKVSLEQKLAIEHDYYPTVSVEVDKKSMDDFADAVLSRINTKYPKIHIKEQVIESQLGADHFIAYSPSRVRR